MKVILLALLGLAMSQTQVNISLTKVDPWACWIDIDTSFKNYPVTLGSYGNILCLNTDTVPE